MLLFRSICIHAEGLVTLKRLVMDFLEVRERGSAARAIDSQHLRPYGAIGRFFRVTRNPWPNAGARTSAALAYLRRSRLVYRRKLSSPLLLPPHESFEQRILLLLREVEEGHLPRLARANTQGNGHRGVSGSSVWRDFVDAAVLGAADLVPTPRPIRNGASEVELARGHDPSEEARDEARRTFMVANSEPGAHSL